MGCWVQVAGWMPAGLKSLPKLMVVKEGEKAVEWEDGGDGTHRGHGIEREPGTMWERQRMK